MQQKNLLPTLLIGLLLAACGSPKLHLAKNKRYLATINTSYGAIDALLYNETPIHTQNFVKLSTSGFYDSTYFHRVLKNFVVQGGDPNTKPGGPDDKVGEGDTDYTLEAEFLEGMEHDYGKLAAARMGDDVNPEKRSSGSQFYIVQNKSGAHHLDGSYTVFGEIVNGMETVNQIADQEVERGGRPIEPVYIKNVGIRKLSLKKLELLFGYTEK